MRLWVAVLLAALIAAGVAAWTLQRSGAPHAPTVGLTPNDRFQPTAVAFFDAQRGLIGGSLGCPQQCQGVVARSQDGGKSWSIVYRGGKLVTDVAVAGNQAWAVLSSCAHGGQGCNFKLVGSIDQGVTWRSLTGGPVSVSFANAKEGWGVPETTDPTMKPTILTTGDGGQTWTAQAAPCGQVQTVERVSSSQGWVLCVGEPGAGNQGKAIKETTDGGRTWSTVAAVGFPGSGPAAAASGLGTNGYPEGLQILAGGQGWLWQARGSLLATTDGGRHWQANALTKPEVIEARDVWAISGKVVEVIVQNDEKRAFQLMTSTDGGQSWSVVQSWPIQG